MAGELRMIACVLMLVFPAASAAAPPRVTNEKFELELVASEPEIVTPIGMTFDREGRLLVVESHTHQRAEGYDGPAGDRVRMLTDTDGDGRLDRWSTFAEGFRHAMNVLVRDDGGVYLVTRGKLLLLQDTDKDGKADREQELLRLETEDDYPHNALGGIALASNGTLIIGLGENHGMAFRLIGSDGKVITGTGGLDGIFRSSRDGRNLEHIARGVWNPFSLCALDDGRIFAVDNDPDSSPPCRLLHVVEGGDYGYLYQYGRAGTHPLQAWNGELPGTLPMVCGVGEAPTAIVAHGAWLWVTSWGDHRIERYRLVPRGASYGATREVVVQGDADFRPTGMAVAPDGSLYFGDWTVRNYEVHGKGRVWRLVLTDQEKNARFPPRSSDERARAPNPLVDRSDPFQLRTSLKQGSRDERLFAVRWIADERIMALGDDVAKLLDTPPPDAQYYLAVLAAVDWLDHEPRMRGVGIGDELLVRELENQERSPATQALALRLLSPEDGFLTIARLRGYLRSNHVPLRLEAVRSLAQQLKHERFELLAQVAGDDTQDVEVRAEAIVGLAAAAENQRDLLKRLAEGENRILREESQRAMRLAGLSPVTGEAKPPAEDLSAWSGLLQDSGNAVAGRRVFFNPVGSRCGVCHQHGGRGGRIGPDLTKIGSSNNREQIIASILKPSQEIAPHYQPWVLVTKDGKTHTGLRLHKAGDDGMERYVDAEGKEFTLESEDIELRDATRTSIMPEGLQDVLSIADLRDLVTFLSAVDE